MRDVGYELYQSMLEEAIAKIKAGELEGLSEADDQWAPQINLGVPVLIPDAYVPDLDVRLGLIPAAVGVEYQGRAGRLCRRADRPLRQAAARGEHPASGGADQGRCAKRPGIAKLDGGPKGATIQFHNDKFAESRQGLVTFVQDQRGLAKVQRQQDRRAARLEEGEGQNSGRVCDCARPRKTCAAWEILTPSPDIWRNRET